MENSLTPSYVKQFFTKLKTVMKCVGLPSDIVPMKPMCLWVENFWPTRRGTLMWSANLSGSRKQSLRYHLLKPFNLPVLLESRGLLSPSWQGRCVRQCASFRWWNSASDFIFCDWPRVPEGGLYCPMCVMKEQYEDPVWGGLGTLSIDPWMSRTPVGVLGHPTTFTLLLLCTLW